MLDNLLMVLTATAMALSGALGPGRQIPTPKPETAALCATGGIRPNWDLRELYFDAVGHLRWIGWSNIDSKRRDSAIWGIPLRSSRSSNRRKIQLTHNEEVKVLAWSISEVDRKESDSGYAAPQLLPRVLLWVRYTFGRRRPTERWALMDMWRGTRSDSASLGTRWHVRWPVPCIDVEDLSLDSVHYYAVRKFDRPPTNADIYRFIDERACIDPNTPMQRSDFFTFTASAPTMRMVRLDSAICADMWSDVVGVKPERYFVVR